MFTGIIEEIGKVKQIIPKANIYSLETTANITLEGTKISDSIAVNGVCLTVVGIKNGTICFDVIEETSKNTNLSLLRIGEKVNLERALKMDGRLSGHFVSGHIDCLGLVKKKIYLKDSQNLTISFPAAFNNYLISKGSISIDGVSLTIQNIGRNDFSVSLIPHTLKSTNLGDRNIADKVNLEFDLLGKYVLRERNLR